MTEIDYLQNLMEITTHEEENAARRRGTTGPWCFACGHENGELARCCCAFPSEFGCAKLRSLCADCRRAHAKVAAHLESLFRAKLLRVHRADARRSRLFRFLRDALEALASRGDVRAKTLRFLLGGHCDPRADEESEFRKTVLDCFQRSHFSDFYGLAFVLAEEEKLYDVMKIADALPPEFLKQFGA